MKIRLYTNVAGGYLYSMTDAIRKVSMMRKCLALQEIFRLATSNQALGLGREVETFEVGKEFWCFPDQPQIFWFPIDLLYGDMETMLVILLRLLSRSSSIKEVIIILQSLCRWQTNGSFLKRGIKPYTSPSSGTMAILHLSCSQVKF